MIHISASAEGASEKILMDTSRVCEKFAYFHAASFHKRCTKKTAISKCFRIAFSQNRALPCHQLSLKEIMRAPKARARKFQASLESFRRFWVVSPQTRQKSSTVSIHCHQINRSKNWTPRREHGNGQTTFSTPSNTDLDLLPEAHGQSYNSKDCAFLTTPGSLIKVSQNDALTNACFCARLPSKT